MFGDGGVHVEQVAGRLSLGSGIDAARTDRSGRPRHRGDRGAQPGEVGVGGGDERRGPLLVQEGADRAVGGDLAGRAGVRREAAKALGPLVVDVTAEGIEAADQRPVGMHRAALGTEEDAGAVVAGLGQDLAGAVLGEAGGELAGGDAAVAGQARDLVGIELDLLVATAVEAAAADVAERLVPRFTRRAHGTDTDRKGGLAEERR